MHTLEAEIFRLAESESVVLEWSKFFVRPRLGYRFYMGYLKTFQLRPRPCLNNETMLQKVAYLLQNNNIKGLLEINQYSFLGYRLILFQKIIILKGGIQESLFQETNAAICFCCKRS